MTKHRGEMERRLADADDGRTRERPRGLEPGIVETGDDECPRAVLFAFRDLLQHARHGESFVEIALDRRGPMRRIDRDHECLPVLRAGINEGITSRFCVERREEPLRAQRRMRLMRGY